MFNGKCVCMCVCHCGWVGGRNERRVKSTIYVLLNLWGCEEMKKDKVEEETESVCERERVSELTLRE